MFFIASNGRLEARWHLRSSHGRKPLCGARWHLRIPHERKPSRFVLNIECCLGAREHRREALSSTNTFPRSLTWCIESPTAYVLNVKLLREDEFCELARQTHSRQEYPSLVVLVILKPRRAWNSQDFCYTWRPQVQDVHLSSRKNNGLIAPQLSNRH